MAFSVRNAVAGLSAREKKMAAGMLAAMVVIAVALVAFFVRTAISDVEEENGLRAETLRFVALAGPKYQQRKAEQAGDSLGQEKPPPLQTLVDGIAKKNEMPNPDTKELPDQNHDDAWEEHGAEISWREISLLQLTRFMEDVEANKRRYPIAITRLEVRKRRPGEDALDVIMVISTYEKAEGGTGAAGPGKGAKAAPRQGDR